MKKESDLFSHGVCQKCGKPLEVKTVSGLCQKHEKQMLNQKEVFDGNIDISDIIMEEVEATENRLDEMQKNATPAERKK
jgi:hypothetical protein